MTKRRERLLSCPYCHKSGIRPCNYMRHIWPCKDKHETQTLLVPLKEPDPWVCPTSGSEIWCDECKDSNGHWPMRRTEWVKSR